MEKTLMPPKYKRLATDKLFITTASGLFLRIAFLVFIFTVGLEFSDPYFIADDLKYEELARSYLNSARGVIDVSVFRHITSGYAELFWPWVLCISSYIFKSIYVSRILNVILSTLCIPVIYNIVFLVSGNKKTALRAANIFAFMPITVFTACFPIKDIFLTFGVMYVLYIFLLVQKAKKISIIKIITCVALLIAISFTRGAVTELLLVFFAVYYTQGFIKKKNYIAVCVTVIIIIAFLALFGNSILNEFDTKINDYTSYTDEGSGLSLRINGISQIYKLPFTYFFATLQPIRMNLYATTGGSFWLDFISLLNISIYPIAIGNLIYIFMKKKNFFFWLSTFIFYCAVIILSLGIFRHYLFLIPIQMINFSLFTEKDSKNYTLISIFLSMVLFFGIFFLSSI